MNAMVGNSKIFYAGYLTTNIKSYLQSFMISYHCIFEIYCKIFILGSDAEGISTLTPGQVYKRADEI